MTVSRRRNITTASDRNSALPIRLRRSGWSVARSVLRFCLPTLPQFDGVPDALLPQYTRREQRRTTRLTGIAGIPAFSCRAALSSIPVRFSGWSLLILHSLMPGFADTFNIGVQYELTPNMRLEVAYVGNRGHHLPDTALAWNEPSASTFLNVEKQNPGLVPYGDFSSWNFSGTGCTKGGPVPSGFGFGAPYVGITCPYDGFTGPALAALAPSPQLANWSTATWFFTTCTTPDCPWARPPTILSLSTL